MAATDLKQGPLPSSPPAPGPAPADKLQCWSRRSLAPQFSR